MVCFDLVLLQLDQLIQPNNKQAMQLHLQQQLPHTMHKGLATTRRPIKRQPHREPTQVSIYLINICNNEKFIILFLFTINRFMFIKLFANI